MKFSTSQITTVLVGIFTFIKYGTSCDLECDSGYRCSMSRSTCDYPPCPYFPTCVLQHDHDYPHGHNTHRHHQQRHAENDLQRHEGRHRNHHRHRSTLINSLLSDTTTTESQEIETVPSHPGRCPAASSYGPCITTCRNDGDCQASEKCCGNGCGRVCTTANNGFKIKAGTCPRRVRRVRVLHRDCRTECSYDNECPGIQKCCSSACGSKCSDPCFHWLTINQRSSGLASIWHLPFLCRS